MKSFLKKIGSAGLLYCAFVLSLLWFDIEWCAAARFSAFGTAELWISLFGLPLLLCAPVYLAGARKIQLTILALFEIWLLCNIMYSRTYFAAIPAGSYLLAANLSDFTGSVTDSLRVADLMYVLIFAGTGIALRAYNKYIPSRSSRRRYLIALAIAVAGMTVATLVRGGFATAWAKVEDHPTHHANLVPMYTPLGSIIHDITATRAGISDAERTQAEDFLNKINAPATAVPRYDNIVLILCESLESWPIGLKIEGKEITPVLNSLLADSSTLYFPNIITQVGAGRSIDAQLLINAGLMPLKTGVYSTHYTDNTFGTLTKALGAPGLLLTVDKPVMWNQGAVARAFGIDRIISREDWSMDETTGDSGARISLSDGSFLRQAVGRLPELWPAGEPRFVQVVTHSGHAPFVIPDELKLLHLSGDYPTILRDYIVTANYTDASLKPFIDYLRARPDFERTLVVITGDHEGLAAYRDDLAARYDFVSPDLKTPLIVLNAPQGGSVDKTAGQADIYPTLLKLAGLDAYWWQGVGCDILSDSHPGAAIDMRGRLMSDSTVPETTIKYLTDQKKTSDIILRGDLLNKNAPK